MKQLIGMLLVIGIAVMFFACDIKADYGKTISDAQMANMYGGGCDRDCDPQTTTCESETSCAINGAPCRYCSTSVFEELCGPLHQELVYIMCSYRAAYLCSSGNGDPGQCGAGTCYPSPPEIPGTPDCAGWLHQCSF